MESCGLLGFLLLYPWPATGEQTLEPRLCCHCSATLSLGPNGRQSPSSLPATTRPRRLVRVASLSSRQPSPLPPSVPKASGPLPAQGSAQKLRPSHPDLSIHTCALIQGCGQLPLSARPSTRPLHFQHPPSHIHTRTPLPCCMLFLVLLTGCTFY